MRHLKEAFVPHGTNPLFGFTLQSHQLEIIGVLKIIALLLRMIDGEIHRASRPSITTTALRQSPVSMVPQLVSTYM